MEKMQQEKQASDQQNLEAQDRYIIHLDMDCYYAQVEMKRHNIDANIPFGVQQWNTLVAVNYAAKNKGVKRGMSPYEALDACPDTVFAHVATLTDNNLYSDQQKFQNTELQDIDGQVLIPSNISETKILSTNQNIPPHKRFYVEMRDKEKQKVSLYLYREESQKIFDIVKRYSNIVEKASCDEAFIDVTRQVNIKFQLQNEDDYEKCDWHGAYFMGCEKGKGEFIPQTDQEKRLYLANEIAYYMRRDIDQELKYKASAGVSYNKTLAKISSSQNKPDAQTVVAQRYVREALDNVSIGSVRMCGGKISEVLAEHQIVTMGDVQKQTQEDLSKILGNDTATWIKELADGICYEQVKERLKPTTTGAVKTFKQVNTFQELEKMIGLLVLDLNQKINEILKSQKIFPTTFQIGFYDRKDGNKHKTRRCKMVEYEEFIKDNKSITENAKKAFYEYREQILPARSLSISVMNYKSLEQIQQQKKQGNNINKFFKQVTNNDEYLQSQAKINIELQNQRQNSKCQSESKKQCQIKNPIEQMFQNINMDKKRSNPVKTNHLDKQDKRSKKDQKMQSNGILSFFQQKKPNQQ